MTVEKLGLEFELPVSAAIDELVDYEVWSGAGYEKVEDEKVLEYDGDLVEFTLGGDRTLEFTPGHVCKVRLDSGEDVLVYASDVEVGMSFVTDDGTAVVSSKRLVPYEGLVYGFEVAGEHPKPTGVRIAREEYDDGSVEFVSDGPLNVGAGAPSTGLSPANPPRLKT